MSYTYFFTVPSASPRGPFLTVTWNARTTSSGQGLIIDEATGANIAVVYDPEDTAMLAAAPALFAALDRLQSTPNDPRAHRAAFDALRLAQPA
jgi:hypothetical protein